MAINHKRTIQIFCLIALVALPIIAGQFLKESQSVAAQQPSATQGSAASSAQIEKATVNDGVYSIKLPLYPPDLPDGEGKVAFASACGSCHSHRYVTMQPRFTRKAWQATVTKMIKVYGAPINDEQAGQIVNYLVQINGKEDEPAK
ncbi:MAG TPA: sulfide dehydrogenase [Blastocatellia bacterium]|nr:sulfide dehydrogenase [Blastocatellia bacterium]